MLFSDTILELSSGTCKCRLLSLFWMYDNVLGHVKMNIDLLSPARQVIVVTLQSCPRLQSFLMTLSSENFIFSICIMNKYTEQQQVIRSRSDRSLFSSLSCLWQCSKEDTWTQKLQKVALQVAYFLFLMKLQSNNLLPPQSYTMENTV